MHAKSIAVAILCLTVVGAHAALTISSTKPTKNVNCTGGVCSATAKNAVLSATDLIAHLADGNLTIASGSKAQDIRVEAAMTLSSANTLTFDSFRSVFFDDDVSMQLTPLVIDIDDGGPGGRLAFGPKGSVQLDPAGSLTIDGESYFLVTDITMLAGFASGNSQAHIALVQSSDQHRLFEYTPVSGTFNGVFEGLGNSMTRYKTDLLHHPAVGGGIFTQIGPQGVVENVIVKGNAFAHKARDAVIFGGLVGINQGLIRGVSVGGWIQSSHFNPDKQDPAGAIAGENDGIILRSRATAKIEGGMFTGGLVGRLIAPGQIIDSWASGRVQTKQNGGGLVGFMSGDRALISNSFATGQVNNFFAPRGFATFIGGLVGTHESGTIQNSYATGEVRGETVDGVIPVEGGLIGHNEASAGAASVSASYSTGLVDVTTGGCTCGGLIGVDEAAAGSLADTYWDLGTSGIGNPSQGAGTPANDPGITGLSSAQFLSGLPTGFGTQFWAQAPNVNGGYPYLKNNAPQ